GLRGLWDQVVAHRDHLDRTGHLALKRQRQSIDWMWESVDKHVVARFRARPDVRERAKSLEADLTAGRTTASLAASTLLALSQ
ncbi:MAG TPA: hypothetical protein PLV68_10220, partial [Ilumatobacteraceae bacterium]|nr:hypothetical protein [Ilumatobacteraceae bacterium]